MKQDEHRKHHWLAHWNRQGNSCSHFYLDHAYINLDTMNEFKQYRRKHIAELRPFQEGEQLPESVSISQADRDNGSPKTGDMIARNPKNHDDQWLVAKQYFEDNFEPCDWCFSFSCWPLAPTTAHGRWLRSELRVTPASMSCPVPTDSGLKSRPWPIPVGGISCFKH